jgi:acetoin utilization deacetylase AcuC-like enzyme
MSELLVVEQPPGESDAASYVLDRHGNKVQVAEDSSRTLELRRGLERHDRVRVVRPHTTPEEAERIVGVLHEPRYLKALRAIDSDEPALLAEWKPPGLPADSPVWRGVVAAAFEGARTAIAAARLLGEGARFAYAVCRPPGHHAGPAWMGGYCYLNTAAIAASALRGAGAGRVTILDVDFHFPTGTRAMVERMDGVGLHSLHASTLREVPWRQIVPLAHERFVDFESDPGADGYVEALEASVGEIAGASEAIVLSLGYDIVGGDPHGSWSLPTGVFADIGRVLAGSGLPVCVVQEGGYAVELLAECAHAFATGLLEEVSGERPGAIQEAA